MHVSKMRTNNQPAKFSQKPWQQTAAVISTLAENEKDVTILYFAPCVRVSGIVMGTWREDFYF